MEKYIIKNGEDMFIKNFETSADCRAWAIATLDQSKGISIETDLN